MPAQVESPATGRLRRIQAALGVHVDGVLGSETLTALERKLDIKPSVATSSLECSTTGLAQLVAFEVSSPALYEKRYRKPIWPGGESGVTIGIGYDLGFTSRTQIESDWAGRVTDLELAGLLAVQGVKGDAANHLAKSLSHISIPFDVAEQVFYENTLPRYAKLTRETYAGVEGLPADAQSMLLSLIYNRGAKLTGSARTEMAAIEPLVAGGTDNLDEIALQFEAMVRLWPGDKLRGLRDRRMREAKLIRESDRNYEFDELVRV